MYVFSNENNGNPLNLEQLLAFSKAHEKRIFNIQGPPGTGKTTLLKDLVASLYLNNQKVWIASSNNSAVDNVKKSFEKNEILCNLPMIRLGNKENIDITYENLFKNFKNKSLSNHKSLPKSKKEIDVSKKIKEIEKLLMEKDKINNTVSFFQDFLFLNDKKFNALNEEKNPLIKLKFVEKKLFKYKKIIQNKYLIKRKTFFGWMTEFFTNWKKRRLCKKIASLNIFPFKIEYKDKNEQVVFDKVLKICKKIRAIKGYLKLKSVSQITKEIIEIKKEIFSTTKATQIKVMNKNIDSWSKLNKAIIFFRDKIEKSQEKEKGKMLNLNMLVSRGTKIQKKDPSLDGKKILDLFPIVFSTTLPIPKLLKNSEKMDYLIIDEAAQTINHSVLGLLKNFKNIIFLGDTAQLSAVVPLDEKKEKKSFKNLKYLKFIVM